jgi:hypothetical protein
VEHESAEQDPPSLGSSVPQTAGGSIDQVVVAGTQPQVKAFLRQACRNARRRDLYAEREAAQQEEQPSEGEGQ